MDLTPDDSAVSSDLACTITTNATDADNDYINYTYQWYRNGVLFRTLQYSSLWSDTISSADTSAGEEWNCTVTPFDGTVNGTPASDKVTINRYPGLPILNYPANNTDMFTNRTPRYNWTNATDPDNDTLTYTFQLSRYADMSALELNISQIAANSYYNATELDFTVYYWRVRANDGELDGNWSDIFNFSVEKYLSITVETDTIAFGSLFPGDANDTTTNNPPPFRIENDGNWEANISINATSLWDSEKAGLGTRYYQFKANRTDEGGTFDWAASQTSWANMSSHKLSLIRQLNHSDGADSMAVDIRIAARSDEPPSTKTSRVIFWASTYPG